MLCLQDGYYLTFFRLVLRLSDFRTLNAVSMCFGRSPNGGTPIGIVKGLPYTVANWGDGICHQNLPIKLILHSFVRL
jgi:hypothetical protein